MQGDQLEILQSVYFGFGQIWNYNFNKMRSLSRYHFVIKTAHICLEYVDEIA